jgi:hypothetical protein
MFLIQKQGLQPGATVEIDEFDESKYGMCVIINRWNAAIRPFHTALGERGGSTCFGMRGWKIMHYKVREYEAIHTQGMKLIDHVNTVDVLHELEMSVFLIIYNSF